MSVNGRTTTAHRVAFALHNGPVLEGHVVCHSCDYPSCVNPKHLFLGTQHRNVQDAIEKGRFNPRPPEPRFGVDNPSAVLTPHKVRAIRAAKKAGRTQHSLAEQYGVHPMTVSRIVRRLIWKDVD